MTTNLGLRLGLYSTTAGFPVCPVSDVALVDAWIVDTWAVGSWAGDSWAVGSWVVDVSASKSTSVTVLLRSAMNTMLPTCHDEILWMDISMASCYLGKQQVI